MGASLSAVYLREKLSMKCPLQPHNTLKINAMSMKNILSIGRWTCFMLEGSSIFMFVKHLSILLNNVIIMRYEYPITTWLFSVHRCNHGLVRSAVFCYRLSPALRTTRLFCRLPTKPFDTYIATPLWLTAKSITISYCRRSVLVQ